MLYVPSCTIRLLCPRPLAECTTCTQDGFNSIRDIGILTCYSQRISVPYHQGTGLSIILTAAGITSYSDYCAAFTVPSTKEVSDPPSLLSSPAQLKQNLSSQQCLKLLIHERCNHHSMKTINHWIRSGLLNIDPSVANTPDPICIACQYGKAHRKQHMFDTGSITNRSFQPWGRC